MTTKILLMQLIDDLKPRLVRIVFQESSLATYFIFRPVYDDVNLKDWELREALGDHMG